MGGKDLKDQRLPDAFAALRLRPINPRAINAHPAISIDEGAGGSAKWRTAAGPLGIDWGAAETGAQRRTVRDTATAIGAFAKAHLGRKQLTMSRCRRNLPYQT
ncbi:MAG TPA: hypothetical protein VGG72_30360 [Bryobacteraceae bacterium]